MSLCEYLYELIKILPLMFTCGCFHDTYDLSNENCSLI